MKEADFLAQHIPYIKGLKKPTEQQRLLVMLHSLDDRTPADERRLAVLVKAELAAYKAQRARADAQKILSAAKGAARKARDHELYQVAGLLSLAGLVDKVTGKPLVDRGELLGALLAIAETPADDPRRATWKRSGDAKLNPKPKAEAVEAVLGKDGQGSESLRRLVGEGEA